MLEQFQSREEKALTRERDAEDAPTESTNEVGVELAQEEDTECEAMGPADYAKHLCDKGEVTKEQRGPVALVARDMQGVYKQEVARRANLTDAQRQSEGIGAAEHVTLPLKGRRLRLLLYGGEGCGGTRIINLVLAKLFRRPIWGEWYCSHRLLQQSLATHSRQNKALPDEHAWWATSHDGQIAREE